MAEELNTQQNTTEEETRVKLDPNYGTLYIGGNLSTNLAVMGNVEIAGDLINSKVMASGDVVVYGENDNGTIEKYVPNMEKERCHFEIEPYGDGNGFLMFSGNVFTNGNKYDDMNLDILTDSYVWNEFGTTSVINCNLTIGDVNNPTGSFENMAGTVFVKQRLIINSSGVGSCLHNETDVDDDNVTHIARFIVCHGALIVLTNTGEGGGIRNEEGYFIIDKGTVDIKTKHKYSSGVTTFDGLFNIDGRLWIEAGGHGFVNGSNTKVLGEMESKGKYCGIINNKKFIVESTGNVGAWTTGFDDISFGLENRRAELVVDGKMDLWGTGFSNAIRSKEGKIIGSGFIRTHNIYYNGNDGNVKIEEDINEYYKHDTKLTVNGVTFYFYKDEVNADEVLEELKEYSLHCEDNAYAVYYHGKDLVIY